MIQVSAIKLSIGPVVLEIDPYGISEILSNFKFSTSNMSLKSILKHLDRLKWDVHSAWTNYMGILGIHNLLSAQKYHMCSYPMSNEGVHLSRFWLI